MSKDPLRKVLIRLQAVLIHQIHHTLAWLMFRPRWIVVFVGTVEGCSDDARSCKI